MQLEHIEEVVSTPDALSILCDQVPLYEGVDLGTCLSNFADFLSFSQNIEDLIISVEMEDKHYIHPLFYPFWFKQVDIMGSPSISFYNTGEETRSGILNGIKVLVDLGKTFVFILKQIKIIRDFLETFDNADPTITYDALKLILKTKESFPSFDLEGFSMR